MAAPGCPPLFGADPDFLVETEIRSLEETRTLVKGVEICGGGKWADIKRLGFKEIAARSPVDLKDKWRNLLRVALLPLEQIRLKKVDNRHNLPLDLLQRVKELAKNGDKQPRLVHGLLSRRSCHN